MFEGDVSWARKEEDVNSRKAHSDYNYNLIQSRNFCKNVEKSLLQGMRVYICDSGEIKECLLMITFSPPRKAPMGNFGVPIFMHQPKSEFNKQVEAVFNSYMEMAKKFWNDQQKITEEDFLNAANL